ncbi:TetR/AcrR family transcriptional regulator [Tsukamurella sp. 1534]|uniref:TetR/AcrR family transcriptional regulator n=1 Tax=Tsukamurella sp. 1534 TaxID=1151061 RepID=UPI000685DBBF|nr:TetR/AcrR family transcriptional regulator [Tsukamurella sp. 1534]
MLELEPEGAADHRPRRGRPRSAGLAERRREELTDAAFSVFAEQGYEKASVSEIARRAGIGQGTLYRYVDGKRELLDLVFDRCVDALMTAVSPDDVLSVTRGEVGDAAQAIRALGERLYRLADARPELLRMVLVQAGTVDEELRYRIQGLYQTFDSITVRALNNARDSGWIPDRRSDTEETYALLGRLLPALAVPGIVMALQNDDDAERRETYVSAAVTMLQRGILSDDARAADTPQGAAG